MNFPIPDGKALPLPFAVIGSWLALPPTAAATIGGLLLEESDYAGLGSDEILIVCCEFNRPSCITDKGEALD